MLSKRLIKYTNFLKLKKYRQEYRAFLLEGTKIVAELLQSDLVIQHLFALPEWVENNDAQVQKYHKILQIVSEKELKLLSNLKTPNQVLAIAEIPTYELDNQLFGATHALALDHIQDPGNMGTILRIADWFGLPFVICNSNCVDVFNPKVIQASMGAILRIKVVFLSLETWIPTLKVPIYGALLKGKNVFEADFHQKGLLLLGNESKGINPNLLETITHPITIPAKGAAESLNVAVATGIICALATQ